MYKKKGLLPNKKKAPECARIANLYFNLASAAFQSMFLKNAAM
jgi:hypothetical protein